MCLLNCKALLHDILDDISRYKDDIFVNSGENLTCIDDVIWNGSKHRILLLLIKIILFN